MPDLTEVIRVGTDSSGRGIFMSRYMDAWWHGVLRHLTFEPVIVQGAWMSKNDGGAADSEGYHDKGGCLDIRTRDLSTPQIEDLNHTVRLGGAGGWVRYPSQGFDEHYHLVLGSDPTIGALALQQWTNYLNGDAGLDGPDRDYMWRPNPLVTTPPDDYMEDDSMKPEDFATIRAIVREEIDAQFTEQITVNSGTGTRRISYTQLLRELWQKVNKVT